MAQQKTTRPLRPSPCAPKAVSGLRQYVRVLGFVWLLLVVFRVAFWPIAADDMPEPLGHEAWRAFWIGVRFDARIAALMTLPIALLASIPHTARRLHAAARPLTALYGLLFLFLICLYCLDFGFYDYLRTRLNSTVFELLQDFQVAVDMVWQSYPVPGILLGIFGLTGLCAFIFHRLIRRPIAPHPSGRRRALGFALGFLVFALAVYGRVGSLYPLRWSNAFFSTHEGVICLGLNPIQLLYDTTGVAPEACSPEQMRAVYSEIADLLKVDKPDPATLTFRRDVPATGVGRPPNIVIVIMESLAYPKTSFAPGAGNPTPHLKALAGESLLFRRFFANTRTTARAVFTTMTGVPDISESGTASRNPLAVEQRVPADTFVEYDKYYMIGGSTNWANIRGVLGRNVRGLCILEEGDWQTRAVDVWGIDDHSLFQEAHRILAARDPEKPFLAVIQTAGFHKPYTVPDTPGFSREPLSEADMRNYGYESQEEYDSMRFSDFAVGRFIETAKTSPYYADTIFFIFGDHGLNDPSENMPKGYEEAELAPWHVPLIIHTAPSLNKVRPGESDMPCSQVDVFPTAAGLAGIAYTNWTLGRDIFDPRFDDGRVVLVAGKTGTPVRLVSGDYCWYEDFVGHRRLYRIDGSDEDFTERMPELAATMARQADALLTAARWMLYNNKPRPEEHPKAAHLGP